MKKEEGVGRIGSVKSKEKDMKKDLSVIKELVCKN